MKTKLIAALCGILAAGAAHVSRDDGTNVSLDYKEGDNAFSGKINKVAISVK